MAKRKPGLPAKYAKYGFKKGWAMYRRNKRARVSGKTTGGSNMRSRTQSKPKIIYRTRTVAKPVLGRRRRPAVRLLSQSTMNTVIDGALIGGGAVGSTALVNLTPIIRDQNPWIKAGSQAAAGIIAMSMVKDRYLKKASMGLIVGGAISVALGFIPEGTKVFGRRRQFSPGELHKLRTLGKPYSLGVGVPIPETNGSMVGRTTARVSRYG